MTVKQMQCLLAYLGFYSGGLDGLWGPLSEKAEAAFRVAYGLSGEGLEEALLGAVNGSLTPLDPWERVKYFREEEFRCRCGGVHCDGYPAPVDPLLLAVADRVREHFGVPVILSSGLRCPVHNKRVGGVAGSRHLSGKAMDFHVQGHGSGEVLPYVLEQPEIRYAYAIDGSYLHMDVE